PYARVFPHDRDANPTAPGGSPRPARGQATLGVALCYGALFACPGGIRHMPGEQVSAPAHARTRPGADPARPEQTPAEPEVLLGRRFDVAHMRPGTLLRLQRTSGNSAIAGL